MQNLKSLILIISLTTSGCAYNASPKVVEKVSYVSTPLALPYKPDFPNIKSDSMKCLDDDTKNALIKRDTIMKNYISDLETVITSTQK